MIASQRATCVVYVYIILCYAVDAGWLAVLSCVINAGKAPGDELSEAALLLRRR